MLPGPGFRNVHLEGRFSFAFHWTGQRSSVQTSLFPHVQDADSYQA
uniref:Uncharacterized protein n=1 Tax=Anguilla anguilla TaxID=7936 RepID=A0A0E9VG67_ANGAN